MGRCKLGGSFRVRKKAKALSMVVTGFLYLCGSQGRFTNGWASNPPARQAKDRSLLLVVLD